jgi:serpin B
MRYKKITCISLVAIFLLASASGAVPQQKDIQKSKGNIFDLNIESSGTVKKGLLDKYIIETDDVIEFKGLSFNKVFPVDNNEVIKEYNGLDVNFTGSLLARPILFLLCIFMHVLPIQLTEIEPVISGEKPVDLDFDINDIQIDEEQILVNVILENNGEDSVSVSMLSLERGSLDFEIIKPDGRVSTYIGPLSGSPSTTTLAPGEATSMVVDINSEDTPFGENGVKDSFSTPGIYEIKGLYQSTENLEISLATPLSTFTITEDDPPPYGVDEAVVDAMNSYGIDLYNQFMNDWKMDGENLFFTSCISFTNLLMAYFGASGSTADEIAEVLGIENINDQTVLNTMKSLYKDHLNYEDEVSTLWNNNKMWVNELYQHFVSQLYVSILREYWHSEYDSLDCSNPTEAANIINSWVEEKTNGLIRDLICPDAIHPVESFAFIVSTIYANLLWQIEFLEEDNTVGSFHFSDGSDGAVTFMNYEGYYKNLRYTETPEMQILELPYKGENVSMLFLLPKDGHDLSSISGGINLADLENWRTSLSEFNWMDNKVEISIPTFEIETPRYELKDYLINLGMVKAFDPDLANFDNMLDRNVCPPDFKVLIQNVYHKAYIRVDAKGTEAAGAQDPFEPIVFKADHPFAIMMQHKPTGCVLFMGNVYDPIHT